MSYLLDTNVVGRLVESSAPEHPGIKRAVGALLSRGEELVIAPQVIVEFWAVATRPVDVNGFGWSLATTAAAIIGLRAQFAVRADEPAILDRWFELVQSARVVGKRAHDAKLAAFMLVHAIPFVLTMNLADFQGFPGITAVHPDNVPAG